MCRLPTSKQMSYPSLASRTQKVPVSIFAHLAAGELIVNYTRGPAWPGTQQKRKEHCVLDASVSAVFQVWAA